MNEEMVWTFGFYGQAFVTRFKPSLCSNVPPVVL